MVGKPEKLGAAGGGFEVSASSFADELDSLVAEPPKLKAFLEEVVPKPKADGPAVLEGPAGKLGVKPPLTPDVLDEGAILKNDVAGGAGIVRAGGSTTVSLLATKAAGLVSMSLLRLLYCSSTVETSSRGSFLSEDSKFSRKDTLRPRNLA